MMRHLSWSCAVCLAVAPSWSQGGVVAHWKFDEQGGSTANASVGPWNGLLNGDAAFAPGMGISGGAISLAFGNNSVVVMGDILPFTTGDFSIQAWVKLEPGDRNDLFVVAKHQSGAGGGYILAVNGINPAAHQDDRAGIFVSTNLFSQTTVNDGTWHQIVSTYRALGTNGIVGIVEIFVDGGTAENASTGNVVGPTTAPFVVGGINFGDHPIGLFNGLIDDVQVYDHALSPQQVQFLFDHPGQAVPEPAALALATIALLAFRRVRRPHKAATGGRARGAAI